MNKTDEFLKPYNNLIDKISKAKREGNYAKLFCVTDSKGRIDVPTPEALLSMEARRVMEEQYSKNGYTVIIDDIGKRFNLEDRYIRNNILPYVDYFHAPRYSGSFFNGNHELPFWKQRYYKWKKTFISRESFIQYLTKHLKISYKEVIKKEDAEKPIETVHYAHIDRNIAEYILDNSDMEIVRQTNIKELIINNKLNEFKRKTLNEMRMYEESLGERSRAAIRSRLEKERSELQRFSAKDINLKVYDKEVLDYIDEREHQRLELYIDGIERPSVLYWFLPKVNM